ncbi:cupin domain-containing protein [Methylomonas rhizoryzae]|uniref:regulator n=1 Tax=Methylomonas rhizoryzae TaxID=2608981 RepID=UPI001231F8D1|nr:regulator [Methylomonas rhizoryzae]
MNEFTFDDSRIVWQTLDGFEYLHYRILNIDPVHGVIDVLFKFAAGRQIVLHRHKVLNHTLVIQGEHRLYTPSGDLKEVRPQGSYTVSPASDEPHREGGGAIDAIVLFSIRGTDPVFYQILDDEQQLIAELGWQQFADLYHAQI